MRLAGTLWLPLLLFACGEIVAAQAQAQKRVLVMYSTRRDTQIVAIGERELPRLLDGVPGGLDYYSEYIDRSRFPEAANLEAFRDYLLVKYKDVHLDAVIAIEAPALDVVTDLRSQLFPGTPIIFFTSGPVTDHIENATGLVASPSFTDTLALIHDLQPQVRQIFVVSGAAPGDVDYEHLARQQFRPFETRFAIRYLTGLPSAELQARLSSLPADSAIYYLIVSRDGSGQNIHPLNYLSHLTAIANAPVYSWVDSTIDRGIVGGSLKDQTVQLDALGRLAAAGVVRRIGGQHTSLITQSERKRGRLATTAPLAHRRVPRTAGDTRPLQATIGVGPVPVVHPRHCRTRDHRDPPHRRVAAAATDATAG